MASTKIRILYLYDILKKYTDNEHRLTAEELCALMLSEYGVKLERKSIYRDMELFQEYGSHIVQSGTGYYMAKRDFEPAELRLLISAVQTASFITQRKSEQLIGKLATLESIYQSDALISQANIGTAKSSNEEIYNNIDCINRAIANHRKITFIYFKRNVHKKEELWHKGLRYLVSPYALIWRDDHYYLVCNVEGHSELTHFRVDRIKRIYIEKIPWRHFSEVSGYTTTFKASHYAQQCVNMFGGSIKTVTLKCKNKRISEIFDRFGENIPIELCDDDWFITKIEVAISEGFYGWIAHFFGDIEIVAPEALRDEYKERLKGAVSRYE